MVIHRNNAMLLPFVLFAIGFAAGAIFGAEQQRKRAEHDAEIHQPHTAQQQPTMEIFL